MLLVTKLSAVPLNILNLRQKLQPCHSNTSLGLCALLCPLMPRITLPCNSSFPCKSPAEIYKTMEEGSTLLAVGDVQVHSINYSTTAKAAASNPVATIVFEYEVLWKCFLQS